MNDNATNVDALAERVLDTPMKLPTMPMSCKCFANEIPMANSSSRRRHSGRSPARPQHTRRTTMTNERTCPSRPLLSRRLISKGNTL